MRGSRSCSDDSAEIASNEDPLRSNSKIGLGTIVDLGPVLLLTMWLIYQATHSCMTSIGAGSLLAVILVGIHPTTIVDVTITVLEVPEPVAEKAVENGRLVIKIILM